MHLPPTPWTRSLGGLATVISPRRLAFAAVESQMNVDVQVVRKELMAIQKVLMTTPEESTERDALLAREVELEHKMMVIIIIWDWIVQSVPLNDRRLTFLAQAAKQENLKAKVSALNHELLECQRTMLKAPKSDRDTFKAKMQELQAILGRVISST